MTEKSLPWDGVDVGDALAYAPYAAATWQEMYDDLFEQGTDLGVIIRSGNGLECTLTGDDSPCVVDTGAALILGQYYKNDATVDVAIPRPTTSTRYDRIVLQRAWITKVTRIVRATGVEGAGVPQALVQVVGVAWEIPLAIIVVPLAGAMTITDDRRYRSFPNITDRQGGDPDDWDVQGTTWYKPGRIQMVCGDSEWVGGAAAWGEKVIMFDTPFAKPPIVQVTQRCPAGVALQVFYCVSSTLYDRFTWEWISWDAIVTHIVQEVHWVAFGEEAIT